MEMLAALHRAGYGRLRLSAFWANAGPAPVWFGDIAPVTLFRADHGGVLTRYPIRKVDPHLGAEAPNELPMLSSRRCRAWPGDHPWPEYLSATPEVAAARWLELYPELAAEGLGNDPAYVEWYARMLEATAPNGLVAAYTYWDHSPGAMLVSNGPVGVDRFDLPPSGGG